MTTRTPTRWDLAREARYIPRSGLALSIFIALNGALAVHLFGGRPSWAVLNSGLATTVAILTWWAWDRLYRPLDSGQIVNRNRMHSNLNHGTASVWDLAQHASAWAMRQRAPIICPSLAGLTRQRLKNTPVTRYALHIANIGWSLWIFSGTIRCYSSAEDTSMYSGGPRTGKTQEIAGHIVDAPGFVLVTSTRTDLLEQTRKTREKLGRIIIFNPTALGDIASTARWSVLTGCESYATAQRRAESMIGDRQGEGQFWADQGRRVLAVLLHAAARMPSARLQQVADWVSNPGQTMQDEVIAALKGAPNVQSLVSEVRQFVNTGSATKTSTTTTIARSLQWLADASAAAIGDPDRSSDDLMDVRSILESSCAGTGADTLYLIGSAEGQASVSPLLSALTSEVGYQLRQVAGRMPGGRLDPYAGLFLDEMTLACSEVPVHKWSADMGGRNVNLNMAIQSFAQLRLAYGDDAAAALLNNVNNLIIYGGTKDRQDLEALEKLMGDRLERLDEDDNRYTSVLDGSRISALKQGEIVFFGRGLRPALGTAPQLWHRSITPWWQRMWHNPLAQGVRVNGRTGIDVRTIGIEPMPGTALREGEAPA